jgi:Fe-S oxidoreductase
MTDTIGATGSPLALKPSSTFIADLEKLVGNSFERCYQCGTCSVVCPFSSTGIQMPRKEMVLAQWGLKDELFADPNLWICTTCGNCARLCPREIDIPGTIRAARELYLLDGGATPELAKAFENTVRHGNPLGQPARARVNWTQGAGVDVPVAAKVGKPVDVMMFIECYWAYHPRGQQAAQAFARVLNRLGVDYAVLGNEETCVADSQRMAGETGIFEMAAEKNIATLGKYEFSRLVTPDPHAYNALRKLYPGLGGEYNVMHYTQLLVDLIPEMKLGQMAPKKVTFHDPCYLGRHNGEFEAPRKLIEAIPGLELTEMDHCRENGFCCGAGGGGIWNSSHAASNGVDERLAEKRVKEAVATGSDILAVCCPFEVSMFEDAAKSVGVSETLVVKDIAELLDESMAAAG